jgi:putative sterol carrier protein
VSELADTLRTRLEAASRLPLGQKALNGHDEDFQLDVVGQGPIYVGFEGGKLTVADGPSPRQEPLRFSRVDVSADTLHQIIDGRLSPLQAMESGRLFLRTRLYGGALITILLRAAYDLAHGAA